MREKAKERMRRRIPHNVRKELIFGTIVIVCIILILVEFLKVGEWDKFQAC